MLMIRTCRERIARAVQWRRLAALCPEAKPRPAQRRTRVQRWFVLATLAVLLPVHATAEAGSTAATHSQTVERGLVEVLEALRDAGLSVVYSSKFVKPEMRVVLPRRITTPNERLTVALAQHGLEVELGPNGALLVVPKRRAEPPPSGAAKAALPARLEDRDAASEATAAPVTSASWTLRETIDVVQGNDLAASSKPGARFDRDAIDAQPDHRDPWALFSRVAGVNTDRVDVGGSETGRQAALSAPGASVTSNTYFVDGIEATDLAAAGSSALFYDLDHFATVELGTGGVDVTTPTAGVAVRLTTKRGGNALRGAVNMSLTGGSATANRVGNPGLEPVPAGSVDRIGRFGFDLGGPLVADRLWGWIGLSGTNADTTAVGGERDDTELLHGSVKLNARPHHSTSMVTSLISSDKLKSARGVSPTRALETAWRQDTPSSASKAELTQVLGARAVLSARASLVDGEFSLRSRGDGEAFLDPSGVWQDGYNSGESDRDNRRYEISADLFKATARIDHELRFGGSFRRYDVASSFAWPGGRQASRVACEVVGTCPQTDGPPLDFQGDLIVFYRDGTTEAQVDSTAFWAQDTISFPRTTLDVGLRFDQQRGSVAPGRVEANPIQPLLLPSAESPGVDGGFDWSTLSPRLGLTRAFGSERRTVVRLGFSRFSSQLSGGFVSRWDPVQTASASFVYQDLNGDRDWQSDEPLQLLGVFGINASGSALGESPNRNDPNLAPELTDEIIASVDRDFGSRHSFGARLTWRRVHDIHDQRLLVFDFADGIRVAQPDDYRFDRTVRIVRPDGSVRDRDTFTLRDGVLLSGGTWLTNGDRERDYRGLGLSYLRRQSRHYMVRANLEWGDATWRVPDAFTAFGDPNNRVGSDSDDGDVFAERPRRGETFLHSGWTASVAGNVRIAPDRRWGFQISGNAFAREGHPVPYFALNVAGDGLRREIQVTDRVDEFRNDNLLLVDLRLSKEVRMASSLDATLSLEIFNALDRRTSLDRSLNAFSILAGTPTRTLSPRVFRVGLRLAFK